VCRPRRRICSRRPKTRALLSGSSPGRFAPACAGLSARRGLTRRNALLFFSFLVSPHSGLAQRILDQGPEGVGPIAAGPQRQDVPDLPGAPAAANVRLRQGLLELLKAAFAAPGSPFAADKFVTGGGRREGVCGWVGEGLVVLGGGGGAGQGR
jgi:hypothetical protein